MGQRLPVPVLTCDASDKVSVTPGGDVFLSLTRYSRSASSIPMGEHSHMLYRRALVVQKYGTDRHPLRQDVETAA